MGYILGNNLEKFNEENNGIIFNEKSNQLIEELKNENDDKYVKTGTKIDFVEEIEGKYFNSKKKYNDFEKYISKIDNDQEKSNVQDISQNNQLDDLIKYDIFSTNNNIKLNEELSDNKNTIFEFDKNNNVFIGTEKGNLIIYNINEEKKIKEFDNPFKDESKKKLNEITAMSTDEKYIACAYANGKIALFRKGKENKLNKTKLFMTIKDVYSQNIITEIKVYSGKKDRIFFYFIDNKGKICRVKISKCLIKNKIKNKNISISHNNDYQYYNLELDPKNYKCFGMCHAQGVIITTMKKNENKILYEKSKELQNNYVPNFCFLSLLSVKEKTKFMVSLNPESIILYEINSENTNYFKLKLSKICLCVITRIDKDLLVVISICEYRCAEERRNNLNTVVVCLLIVNRSGLAIHDSLNHLNNLISQSTCILEYGHGLLAIDHVLNVRLITVLTSDDRIIACVTSFESIGNTKSCGVVGAENCVKLCAVSIVTGNDSIHSSLSISSRPFSCSNYVEVDLTGLNVDLTSLDVRLQKIHSTIVEETSVVITRVTCEDFHVVRTRCGIQLQCIDDVLTLDLTNFVVVECSIVSNSVCVHDQTVISNYRDVLLFCSCENCTEGVTFDRCNNENLTTTRDHTLDLVLLCRDVVTCILQINREASCFQLLLHVVAVLVPSLEILCRHCNANLLAVGLLGTASESSCQNHACSKKHTHKSLLHVLPPILALRHNFVSTS